MPETSSVLRVGIVGLGPRGQAYADAFSAVPGAVAAAGSHGDGDGSAAWWGFSSAAEIVASTRIDAIVLTDADGARAAERAREALRRGKIVLWPNAPGDGALLLDLDKEANNCGGVLCVPNELRYLPAVDHLRSTVVAGDAGPLLSVYMSWRTREAPLTKPLRRLGLPLLDLLEWCVGGPFARAQVTDGVIDGARGFSAIVLRHQAGLVATIEVAASLPRGFEQADEVLIEVLGESAALRAEPFNQAITIARGVSAPRRVAWHRDAAYPIVEALMTARSGNGEFPGGIQAQRATLGLLDQLRTLGARGEAAVLQPV